MEVRRQQLYRLSSLDSLRESRRLDRLAAAGSQSTDELERERDRGASMCVFSKADNWEYTYNGT